jgi:ADP-ribose pyrophosphatase YjhB (NUDIX family)
MRGEFIVRRLLQRYWRWQRALTFGARGVIFNERDEVLLVRQTYTPGWIFPGGGVEFHETIEHALAREILEESGIELTGPAELFGIYSNRGLFPGDHVALYVVRHWRTKHAFKPGLEIAAAEFFAPDALPADLTAGTRRRLDEILGKAPPSPFW